ncbi:MAG: hypothetical protein ACW99A_14065 [Candidatus Kariarchaeaceae archaeon]|jgi:hypothetical protein
MGVEIRIEPRPTRGRNFNVELVSLSELIPHEMTIEHALEAFKQAVQVEGIVRHAILLDKSSKLILDGHHRHAGLTSLGYTSCPAILIDYLDDEVVSLDTWYPKIRKPVREIISEFEKEDLEVDECLDETINYSNVTSRKVTAIIGNNKNHWTVIGDRELLFGIIREHWVDEIIYYDNAKHCVEESKFRETAIISWPYTKQEILEFVSERKIHLPKTTRHRIQYNYPDCNYPLENLPRKD